MNKYITVFVPTYNGKKYIDELVDAILSQDLPDGYRLELLITDSGSTDGTKEYLKNLSDPRVTVDHIGNKNFGHGKTRRQACERAKGEFILFLSQDATPIGSRWIIDMIEPFYLGKKVGCVFGRQIPRPSAPPTIKREIMTVFGQFGPPDSIVIGRERSLVDGHKMNELNSFLSNVNSAVRKSSIREVPFRDVKYAEDQVLATDMQNAGYVKAYSVSGAVWHSHEYSFKEYYKRKFDEYIGLQESIGANLSSSWREVALGWVRPTVDDWKFLLRDREYSTSKKLVYFFISPLYNFGSLLGKYHAIKRIHNSLKRKRSSLEASSKRE